MQAWLLSRLCNQRRHRQAEGLLQKAGTNAQISEGNNNLIIIFEKDLICIKRYL